MPSCTPFSSRGLLPCLLFLFFFIVITVYSCPCSAVLYPKSCATEPTINGGIDRADADVEMLVTQGCQLVIRDIRINFLKLNTASGQRSGVSITLENIECFGSNKDFCIEFNADIAGSISMTDIRWRPSSGTTFQAGNTNAVVHFTSGFTVLDFVLRDISLVTTAPTVWATPSTTPTRVLAVRVGDFVTCAGDFDFSGLRVELPGTGVQSLDEYLISLVYFRRGVSVVNQPFVLHDSSIKLTDGGGLVAVKVNAGELLQSVGLYLAIPVSQFPVCIVKNVSIGVTFNHGSGAQASSTRLIASTVRVDTTSLRRDLIVHGSSVTVSFPRMVSVMFRARVVATIFYTTQRIDQSSLKGSLAFDDCSVVLPSLTLARNYVTLAALQAAILFMGHTGTSSRIQTYNITVTSSTVDVLARSQLRVFGSGIDAHDFCSSLVKIGADSAAKYSLTGHGLVVRDSIVVAPMSVYASSTATVDYFAIAAAHLSGPALNYDHSPSIEFFNVTFIVAGIALGGARKVGAVAVALIDFGVSQGTFSALDHLTIVDCNMQVHASDVIMPLTMAALHFPQPTVSSSRNFNGIHRLCVTGGVYNFSALWHGGSRGDLYAALVVNRAYAYKRYSNIQGPLDSLQLTDVAVTITVAQPPGTSSAPVSSMYLGLYYHQPMATTTTTIYEILLRNIVFDASVAPQNGNVFAHLVAIASDPGRALKTTVRNLLAVDVVMRANITMELVAQGPDGGGVSVAAVATTEGASLTGLDAISFFNVSVTVPYAGEARRFSACLAKIWDAKGSSDRPYELSLTDNNRVIVGECGSVVCVLALLLSSSYGITTNKAGNVAGGDAVLITGNTVALEMPQQPTNMDLIITLVHFKQTVPMAKRVNVTGNTITASGSSLQRTLFISLVTLEGCEDRQSSALSLHFVGNNLAGAVPCHVLADGTTRASSTSMDLAQYRAAPATTGPQCALLRILPAIITTPGTVTDCLLDLLEFRDNHVANSAFLHNHYTPLSGLSFSHVPETGSNIIVSNNNNNNNQEDGPPPLLPIYSFQNESTSGSSSTASSSEFSLFNASIDAAVVGSAGKRSWKRVRALHGPTVGPLLLDFSSHTASRSRSKSRTIVSRSRSLTRHRRLSRTDIGTESIPNTKSAGTATASISDDNTTRSLSQSEATPSMSLASTESNTISADPPPPPRMRELPLQGVVGTAIIAGAVLSASPVAGVAMVRQRRLLRLSQGCEEVTGRREAPDATASPMQMSVGDGDLAYMRGLIVGAPIFTFIVAAVLLLLSWVFSERAERPLEKGLRQTRMPSILTCVLFVLCPEVADALGVVVAFGDMILLNLLVMFVGLILVSATGAYTVWVLRLVRIKELAPIVEVDSDDDGDDESNEQQRGILSSQRRGNDAHSAFTPRAGSKTRSNSDSDDGDVAATDSSSSSGGDEDEKQQQPAAADDDGADGRSIVQFVGDVYGWLTDPENEYPETRFVQRHGFVFDAFRLPTVFVAFDYFFASVILSFVAGLADGPVPEGSSRCIIVSATCLGITFIYLVLVCFFRPFLAPIDKFIGNSMGVLSFATSVLNLVSFVDESTEEIDMATEWLAIAAMVVGFISLICVVDIFLAIKDAVEFLCGDEKEQKEEEEEELHRREDDKQKKGKNKNNNSNGTAATPRRAADNDKQKGRRRQRRVHADVDNNDQEMAAPLMDVGVSPRQELQRRQPHRSRNSRRSSPNLRDLGEDDDDDDDDDDGVDNVALLSSPAPAAARRSRRKTKQNNL